MLKCKEFRSGVIRGVDENITLFLKEKKFKKSQIVSVNYSVNSVGTYALIIYEEETRKGLKRK